MSATAKEARDRAASIRTMNREMAGLEKAVARLTQARAKLAKRQQGAPIEKLEHERGLKKN